MLFRSLTNSSTIEDWLILHHTPSVGAVTFGHALRQFGTPQAVLNSSDSLLRKSNIFRKPALDFLAQERSIQLESIERDLEWLEEDNAKVVTFNDDAYPKLLKEIADPPPLLYIRGSVDTLSMPQLAVVGSRNPDPIGKEIAQDFARRLASAGLTITSGMALGIDTAAHYGALSGGSTIAVTGTGLDRVYPARNRELAHKIIEQGGAIVSELPIGTEPRAENFPRRNRIISGLSIGTLVVQAAQKSGSLITARLAMEQGREVFAIPGSIHNPLSRGSHRLIREGVKLVETTDDIVEELSGMLRMLGEQLTESEGEGGESAAKSGGKVENRDMYDADTVRVLDAIGHESILVDQVVENCGLTTETVSSIIMRLEIRGEVASAAGGRVLRLHPN